MRFSAEWAAGRMLALAGAGVVASRAAAADSGGVATGAGAALGGAATGAGAAAGGAVAGAGPPPAPRADWNSVMAADSRPRGACAGAGVGFRSRDSGRIVPETSARRGCSGATAVSSSGETARSLGGSTFLPHAPQNRAPSSSSVAQCGQRDIGARPQGVAGGLDVDIGLSARAA